jgi:Putative prokaryotic signal transducing protein
MKRVLQAPNLALATLWADQLGAAGFAATVQRAFASGIAGELPPDQCLPEVWVTDDSQCEPARALLAEWQRLPDRHWACPGCREIVDGPFEQCWNCGATMPAPA